MTEQRAAVGGTPKELFLIAADACDQIQKIIEANPEAPARDFLPHVTSIRAAVLAGLTLLKALYRALRNDGITLKESNAKWGNQEDVWDYKNYQTYGE